MKHERSSRMIEVEPHQLCWKERGVTSRWAYVVGEQGRAVRVCHDHRRLYRIRGSKMVARGAENGSPPLREMRCGKAIKEPCFGINIMDGLTGWRQGAQAPAN